MRLLDSLAALLFPPHCAFCGKVGVRGVCSDCEKTLPYCKTPFHERAEIGACLAPLKYEGIVRERCLPISFMKARAAARALATFSRRAWPSILAGSSTL